MPSIPVLINRNLHLAGAFRRVNAFLDRDVFETFRELRGQEYRSTGKQRRRTFQRWSWKTILTIPNVLICLWIYFLYWGERTAFSRHIADCDWSKWENWPANAQPHHLIFVADPQIVDSHTYPGRPWPLSTLTIKYTDKYMRRSFSLLTSRLDPDTVTFLGDLFDGGREWSTLTSESPEKRWRNHGNKYWLKEYKRFARIFTETWLNWLNAKLNHEGTEVREGGEPRGRRLLQNLPGNHDLGFAAGVQLPVKQRYNAFFGEGNRVDVIANHSLVSLDSLSLSAYSGDSTQDERVWRPALDFLDDIQNEVNRARTRELRRQAGLLTDSRWDHEALELDWAMVKDWKIRFEPRGEEMPTVLLTHVPLYRAVGTPCGPLRERHPPTAGLHPPGEDPGHPVLDPPNAIPISAGYQYQNVLSPEISDLVTKKIGNISYAFSGDDHDYCDVLHYGYPSAGRGIREITVKSISWAMGVRHPGFQMVSLWNPVNSQGQTLSEEEGGPQDKVTMQTHLCLLPDQLGIFIQYALLLGGSLFAIAVHALFFAKLTPRRAPDDKNVPLLPLTRGRSNTAGSERDGESWQSSGAGVGHNQVASRNMQSRTRSSSPSVRNGGSGKLIDQAGYFGPTYVDDEPVKAGGSWSIFGSGSRRRKPPPKGIWAVIAVFKQTLKEVGIAALLWYFFLLWTG